MDGIDVARERDESTTARGYELSEPWFRLREERTVMSPGPIQFWGPCSASKTRTLCMPQVQRVKQMAICEETLAKLKIKACAGCPPEVLKAVNMLLQGGVDLLRQV
eukprot:s166_g24.t1